MLVKRVLSRLWTDTCTITVKEYEKQGSFSKPKDVVKYDSIPCRISFKNVKVPAVGMGDINHIRQVIVLFLDDEVEIPSGSTILVTRKGKTTEYNQSGEPRYHHNHLEVDLLVAKDKS